MEFRPSGRQGVINVLNQDAVFRDEKGQTKDRTLTSNPTWPIFFSNIQKKPD
jgi:hypothetical protein